MSRYIDADALIGQYNKFALTAQTDYAEGVRDVINDINNAPTIDIVTCKECKHWEGEERQGFYYFEVCSRTRLDALCDDFCSYGERREP